MKIYFFLPLALAFSCGNPKTDAATKSDSAVTSNQEAANPLVNVNTDLFKGKVVIILAEPMKDDSKELNIQDYKEKDFNYIPVFTSMEKFTESTQGVDIGKEKIEIDGMFFLSLMKGGEMIRINPSLPDDKYFKASDLISKYKSEIEKVRAATSK